MSFKSFIFINRLVLSVVFLFSQISIAEDDFSDAVYYGENVDLGVLGENNRYYLVNGEDANPEIIRDELGYMRSGMENHMSSRIIADSNIDQLFANNQALRNTPNVRLPADFTNLIGFISGYIKYSSAQGTEQKNGVTNLQLAHEIVKASFCFGTDPFMIASKIRRETTFNRTAVSTGSAVGFSQMTGDGIDEVQHQMSGDTDLAVEGARNMFMQGIRCYVGSLNFNFSAGTNEQIKDKLQSNLQLDLIFGQILTKTYLSYVKSKNTAGSNLNVYRETFSMYNGDDQIVRGQCMNSKKIELKHEYACDVISFFSKLRRVWHQFLNRNVKNKPV